MARKPTKKGGLRTLEAIAPEGQMIAPRHLVEVIGLSHWTLATHKIWLKLLHHAWGELIDDPRQDFEIQIADLRGSHNANDRLSDHLLTMQKTVASATHNGKTTRVQMLGGTTMDTEEHIRGTLRYNWPKDLIAILRKPALYGKLEIKTVNAFTSKYALRLYTIIAQRVGLNKTTEEISVDTLRDWLGVEAGKLAPWSNLKKFAVDKAAQEVNDLCALFSVEIEPVKVGKAVRRVRVSWQKREPFSADEQKAVTEVNRHKAGRRARLAGTVETVADVHLSEIDIQKGYEAAAQICRIDKHAAYADWRGMVTALPERPKNLTGHFIEFCRKRARAIA
jgi:plasmid replication initiation protein